MKELDKMIDEAIGEEERELLRQIDEEPGFFSQMSGVFGGRTGWVNTVLLTVQTVFFLAGIWAGWMFFAAGDPVSQLRWGLQATMLLLMGLMLKMMVWPSFQANRLLRELKLIQLQLARNAGRADPGMKKEWRSGG